MIVDREKLAQVAASETIPEDLSNDEAYFLMRREFEADLEIVDAVMDDYVRSGFPAYAEEWLRNKVAGNIPERRISQLNEFIRATYGPR